MVTEKNMEERLLALEDHFSKLEKQVFDMQEKIDALANVFLTLDQAEKIEVKKGLRYLMLMPAGILNKEDTGKFTAALKQMGYEMTVVMLPKTEGIKIVEEEQK